MFMLNCLWSKSSFAEVKKKKKWEKVIPKFQVSWSIDQVTLIVFIFVYPWWTLPACFCFIFHFRVANVCFDLLKRNIISFAIFFLMIIFFLLSSKCTFRGTLKAFWYFFDFLGLLSFWESCHGKVKKRPQRAICKIFSKMS